MLLNILRQLNWLDIIMALIIIRACCVAFKSGFPAEFFKLLGIVAAVYVSLHYYTFLSDFLRARIPLEEKIPLGLMDLIVFLLLAASAYLFFALLRVFFLRFIKMEAVSSLNKWGGLALGLWRSVLLVSLIIFALAISGIPYLKNSVKNSYSGRRLAAFSVDTYFWIWDNAASNLVKAEKLNHNAVNIKKELALK